MPSPGEVAHRAVRLALEVDLAELHADDAAVREVAQALGHHLARVEVALGEHERARGGGVHRRVAVRGDEPDQVVALAVAHQERAALGVHQRDAGVVAQVARVVGEAGGQQRDGDGIQLDGGDARHPEVERGEDLLASRRADDEHALELPAELERVRPRVALEAAERPEVAVEARQDRAPHPVVVEDVVGIARDGVLHHVDAEDRIPAREEDPRGPAPLRAHGLGLVDDRVGEDAGEERQQEERGGERRTDHGRGTGVGEAEAEAGEQVAEPGEHDAPRGREEAHQRHARGARERGAEEVRAVEPGHVVGPGGEDRRERDAAGQELPEQRGAHQRELQHLRDLVGDVQRVQLRRGDEQVAERDGEPAGEAAARDEAPRAEASERRPGRDQHAAGAEAEERDADDQVREVVEELEREDARVADLEHDHGEGHEEELEVAARLRVGRHADAPHSRRPSRAANRGGACAHWPGAADL